jgi:hypothetical protein
VISIQEEADKSFGTARSRAGACFLTQSDGISRMKISTKAGLSFVLMGLSLPILGRLSLREAWDDMERTVCVVLLASCATTVFALSLREKLKDQREKLNK